MNWREVLAYVDSVDPAFRSRLKGVPEHDIALTEGGLHIRLPASYREFLLLMGVDSGDLSPLTAVQNHSFYDVLELLPDDDYPAQRYFRVAFADDETQISPPDTFLDLARSDGYDAPLVAFEGGGGFDAAQVQETGFTFGEQISQRVFEKFGLERSAQKEVVYVSNLGPDEARNRLARVSRLLTQMRFEHALPPMPRVVGMHRPDARAAVVVREPLNLLRVVLGAADKTEARVLADQILTAEPEAELYRTDQDQ
jgi:hypothetical protein